jgi:hypothetical protein
MIFTGCGKDVTPPPVLTSKPALAPLVAASSPEPVASLPTPVVSFGITEPKKGTRVKVDSGTIKCKGTMKLTPGSKKPKYVFVEFSQNDWILASKTAMLLPDEAENTFRFEIDFDVETKGKHSLKAKSMISSAEMIKVGDPRPVVWNDTTDNVHFDIELPKNKIEPLD